MLIRIAVACLSLAPGLALSSADPPSPGTVPVEIERVSERVAVLRCPVGSNVTAIKTRRGVVVVDTGSSPGLMRILKAQIESLFGPSDFPFVINTHAHWDHCTGNQIFPQAAVIGHAASPAFMRHIRADSFRTTWGQESLLSRERGRLGTIIDPSRAEEERAKIMALEQVVSDLKDGFVSTPPTVTFQDRYDLNLGDLSLQLLDCGAAHTVTDIVVYIPEERIVLTGDLFCGPMNFCFRVTPLIDALTLLGSIDHVLDQGVDVVVPGHGSLMSGGDLRSLRDRLAKESAGLSGVQSAARTLEETLVADGIVGARLLFHGLAADSSTVGYLSDEEFFQLGNRLVEKDREDEARAVFELAVRYFPESTLMLSGLGNACLIDGDTLSSIAAYEQVLGLDPEYRPARSILQWLRGE